MDKKKYYDFLHHIPRADGETAHTAYEYGGYIAGKRIPFKKGENAVSFVMDVWPELTPDDNPVIYDKEKAVQIAKVTAYELVYLRRCFDNAIAAKRAEYDGLCKRVNSFREIVENPEIKMGIWEQVQLKVLEKQVEGMRGYLEGMSDCWSIIHNRAFELLEISNEPYPPEWRF